MLSKIIRAVMASALVSAGAVSVSAQQPPTTAQAQAMLQRPEVVEQLKQRLAASGLTPEQVRARLRDMGYPESMLDAYLPGVTTSEATPSDDVLRAVDLLMKVDAAQRPEGGDRPAAAAKVPEVQGLPIFGLDVFRRSTSEFEPTLAGPVDASYRVGPRDVLALIITGGIEMSHTLEVTREGFVVIPQVGQVYVNNLTMEQVNDVLYSRLRRVYSGIGRGANASTHFYVTVAKLRTNQVFVIGEAVAPGSYQVSSAGTILTALYAAGGPTANGTLRNVELRRGGQVIATLDIYDYLLRGNATRDLRLETGDVVFIPVHGSRVTIEGEIIRPAAYELKPTETLADLIAAAGGFTPEAARRRVQVRRILPPGRREPGGRDRVVLEIASDQLATGTGPALPLEPGDQVRVFGIASEERDRIEVGGNVWFPGPQGFTPGMRLSDALRLAGGVKPDVYIGQILIKRLNPSDSTRISIHAAFSDSTGVLVQDIPLREYDEIRVFSVTEFRPDRTVTITGAVRNPVTVPYREGMTLREVVALAGGLQQGAYLREAEIARLPEDRTDGELAERIRVPLDSTYLLERGPDGKYLGPPGIGVPAKSGAGEVRLEPYDRVLVLWQPDWELQRSVTVTGEVEFPGTYSLLNKNERISDLIKRAGGLTPRAYAGGVRFIRTADNAGVVGVALAEVLRDPSRPDNFILQPGDSLQIPEYRPLVRVTGAVNSPVAVAYKPGKNMRYYVAAAGGLAANADKSRAFVRQPNGSVEAYKSRAFLIPDHVPEPRAGAVIVIPAEDPADKRDYVAIVSALAQVLASTVAIVAIATRR